MPLGPLQTEHPEFIRGVTKKIEAITDWLVLRSAIKQMARGHF